MERFSQREIFLLGYAAQRSSEGPSSLPNVDFNDVFGGPPRRFSLPGSTRYSSYGSMDTDETALFRSLSSGKSVFGEESSSNSSVNRRKHHQGNDFFDDIFQGDKSCSSPRRDFLNSLPGLQIMSPSRPLPPKSEPFGTLVHAQFSLPATLNKAMNYPKFGSSSSFMKKEGTSPNSLLSRFSSQSIHGQDGCRNDAFPSNRPSPLSNAESSNVTKSNETEMRGNSKGNSIVTEAPTDINQFHFSIYRWSGEGAPLVMPPPHDEISSKVKEKDKLKRCSSSNGRIRSDNACDAENHSISMNFGSSNMEHEKLDKTSTLKREETCHIVEEDVLNKPKPEVLETVENFPEERKTNSPTEMSLSEKTEKNISMVKEEARKPELKSLRSILQDEIERLDNADIILKGEGGENVPKTTQANAGGSKNVKKHKGKKINTERAEVNKANIPGRPKFQEEISRGVALGERLKILLKFSIKKLIQNRKVMRAVDGKEKLVKQQVLA